MPKIITDKLTAGVALHRDKRGQTEWFIVKNKDSEIWELPKADARRGESSVMAAVRLMDSLGETGRVLEEAGRTTLSKSENGAPVQQKIIFYLMKKGVTLIPGTVKVESKWAPYVSTRRQLALVREQKALRQANAILKIWIREQKLKNRL